MNNFIRACVFTLMSSLAAMSWAEPLNYAMLADVTQSPESMDGEFTQTKFLAVLQVGVKSSGRFSYQRDKQVTWLTEQPVVNELIITPTALISRQGGDELLRLDTQKNPAAVILGDIIFSVLTADWSVLARYFTVTGDLNDGSWQAELLPSDESIRQSVTRVELQGDTLLRQIVLHEANGDVITIQFQNLQF
ncbi:outer membrane lipoprotein carrier protein LolA [Aliamphritea spongicola]|uniref:outer membrane lipoprotein carrier protein LolA n=1 Tax=Aliamphritea spongicola TaxID=707589 RepID=UPI00196B4FC3|nr:outer membrane lipoprotein carrier protein LolA [Aliamphritea spongicola]MBN3564433.1 outer membrane lipoprotein carrier protein LolA [Aliamphritea spongicola]